jgi:hypothetical protein
MVAKSAFVMRAALMLGFMFTLAGAPLFAAGDDLGKTKMKVIYRKIKATKAYVKPSSEPHVNIKITPPKTMGPKSNILVEAWNNTDSYIAAVDFDMILNNDYGYDMSSHVNVTDMRPGRSALRMVAAPGKGSFPEIKSCNLEHLQIYNDKAAKVIVTTYVDLITN